MARAPHSSVADAEAPGPLVQRLERLREPHLWLVVACWTVVAFSSLQILMFSFGRDQSIYALIGDGVLRGEMPYRDLWDFKPPGIYLIYALAQLAAGKGMWGVRLLEIAGLVASVFGLAAIARSAFGDSRAGLLGGALMALTHAQLEFWHTAQPETFAGYLTIAALVLTFRSTRAPWEKTLTWLGIGGLFGAAFLLKPPLGGGALICTAYLARREWHQGVSAPRALRAVGIGALGSLVPIALVALWFWLAGAWGALSFTLFEFAPGYTALGWQNASLAPMLYRALTDSFVSYSALLPAGTLAALIMRPIFSREREGILVVLGVLAMQLLGVTMQAKFFPYHFGATFPLIALIAGLGFYKIWRATLSGGLGGALAFLSLCYFLAQMKTASIGFNQSFWQRCQIRMSSLYRGEWFNRPSALDARLYYVADYNLAANVKVANDVHSRTSLDQRVLVWGFEPSIYWLANRRPATKYVYNVPQRAVWDQARARRDFLTEIRQTPPQVIVVQHGDVFSWVTGNRLDSAASLRSFPELKQVMDQDFHRVLRIEDFDVYERRPRGAKTQSNIGPARKR